VDSHIQLMAASVLSPRDVLVAVSNSGLSREVLEAVEIAKNNGCVIIGLTRPGSPLAEQADCLLAVPSREDGRLYTPMVSRLLHLAVIDILVISLALRLGEAASSSLAKGKRSVEAHRASAAEE
jgi:transcriptional regulator, RpiR family